MNPKTEVDRKADIPVCPTSVFGMNGITRRDFLQETAAVAGGLVTVAAARAAEKSGRRISPRNIRHITVDRDAKTWCGHLRQGGIKSFGNGELAVLYWRAPQGADLNRAEVVLRRSCDNGQTWLPKDDVVLWSNALPFEKSAEFLCQDPGRRSVLDMSRPEAMFFFGRTAIRLKKSVRYDARLGWTCEAKATDPGTKATGSTVFQIRSVDRGRTWERVPLVLDPPPGAKSFWKDNHPLVTMPDGALVGAMESDGALWLYGSECQGMTWQYLSRIAAGGAGCAGLILRPGGRLQCYMAMRDSLWVSESENCFSWSEPRAIASDVHDPWPLRLRDGRIIVVFARRQQPAGLGVIVSEDAGKTWSDAAVIGGDMSEPVVTELDDGRIFTAYGARFIGGSFFELG